MTSMTTGRNVEGEDGVRAAERASTIDECNAFVVEAPTSSLLAAAASDFVARGLAIVPAFLSHSEVEALREECDALVRARKAEGEGEGGGEADFLVGRAGCVLQTLPRGSRGAAAAASGDSLAAARARSSAPCTPRGAELALGKKLASLAEALLRRAEKEEDEDDGSGENDDGSGENDDGSGENEDSGENGDGRREKKRSLVLIGEQYIVKPARGGPGTAFAWHTDGAWLEAGAGEAGPREPLPEREAGAGATAKQERKKEKKKKTNRQAYLSVWIPLDDVSPRNGGLVLPGEEAIEGMAAARRRRRKGRGGETRVLDADGGDDGLGDDSCLSSSIPLVAAAGTAVAMASWLRHASGPNDSERARRAWMPQLKLGAVEVEGEGEEGENRGDGGGGDRARATAAARETWRVPVPCPCFL